MIELHKRDLALLNRLQEFFGVGRVYIAQRDSAALRVESLRDLTEVIIPHFNKYPLITQKQADFLLFKQVVEIMNRGEHLTPAGLQEIVNLKASLNNGLSRTLISAFPNTQPVPRSVIANQVIQDPNWFTGFVDGEGCFYVGVSPSKSISTGYTVTLKLQVTQHIRDEELLQSLIAYFGCGRIEKDPRGSKVYFLITRFSDITEKLIPLLEKYPLQGVKALDYADFKQVANIMKSKGHLTEQGLEEIQKIKAKMNKGREE